MNILVLCTYPVSEPRHGGQIRVKSLIDQYRLNGHKVEVAGVLGSDSYPPELGFVSYPGGEKLKAVMSEPFLMEDYCIGRLFDEDDYHYQALKRNISRRPDVIEVEHPWLFRFAEKYIRDCSVNIPIIYSSHNVEYRLKKSILDNYSCGRDVASLEAAILEMELYAISRASGVICVSEKDLDWVKSKRNDVVCALAPNGVTDWHELDSEIDGVAAVVDGKSYALYCASGHPPNVEGFFKMFGGGFGSLKPDEALVVAGGAGYSIAGDDRVHRSAKLAEKVVVAGVISDPALRGLLRFAHCIVLPVTQGGGTNLKTAEALWSGKYVLATSLAMRGFERYLDSAGVYVCDDSDGFKRMLREIMARPPLTLERKDWDERKAVLWESCLSSLSVFIAEVMGAHKVEF